MKKIFIKKGIFITIAALLPTAPGIFGQDIDLPTDRLQALLCKKWEIDYVLMGGMRITRKPDATDITYNFSKDKTFTTSRNGGLKNNKDTWYYDEKKNSLIYYLFLIRPVINIQQHIPGCIVQYGRQLFQESRSYGRASLCLCNGPFTFFIRYAAHGMQYHVSF